MPNLMMGFAAAMKHFFGLLPDQNLSAFAAELKALSQADRDFFRAGLEANGYTLTS